MKSYKKKVSVIMGVYNQWDEQALLDAVNSILEQTLKDLEFIIYDDGSDEKAAQYIRGLANLDERIVLIGKEENHGLAFSLNECIHKAQGEYIARMDADDISLPTRLEKQVEFLEQHHEYMWCGCNSVLFDEEGIHGVRKMPEIPQPQDYLKFSPYIHPSVMYRAKIFDVMDGYNVSRETLRCEDYEIFMRFQQAGYRGYNLQEYLFKYRENKDSFQRRSMTARMNESRLRYRNFKEMGLLWPTGWVQVLRPVIAGFVPHRLLMWAKRSEARKVSDANRTKEPENGVLQSNIARETNL